MQVFIVGSPLETAMALDKRRLNRQLQEVKVILASLNGAKAWSNHPCVLQYRGYEGWLQNYLKCLECYMQGKTQMASVWSILADDIRPDWHTQEYYDQMKRRLYTKDNEHYNQWEHLGESQENLYYVDGEWRKYVNGKRVE
jgi:hypothetical protein